MMKFPLQEDSKEMMQCYFILLKLQTRHSDNFFNKQLSEL